MRCNGNCQRLARDRPSDVHRFVTANSYKIKRATVALGMVLVECSIVCQKVLLARLPRFVFLAFGKLWAPLEVRGKRLRDPTSLDTSFMTLQLGSIVERAHHSIAIDEHRQEHDVTLRSPKEKSNHIFEARRPRPAHTRAGQAAACSEQCWIARAQAHVDDGYLHRRLSDLTFRWRHNRAAETSLGLKPISLGSDIFRGLLMDS